MSDDDAGAVTRRRYSQPAAPCAAPRLILEFTIPRWLYVLVIDHPHRCVMTSGQRIHDPGPIRQPVASERSDYSKWCGDHRSPADRAREHL